MRNKKLLSVILAASMVMSMNSFTFADEVVEVSESGRVETVDEYQSGGELLGESIESTGAAVAGEVAYTAVNSEKRWSSNTSFDASTGVLTANADIKGTGAAASGWAYYGHGLIITGKTVDATDNAWDNTSVLLRDINGVITIYEGGTKANIDEIVISDGDDVAGPSENVEIVSRRNDGLISIKCASRRLLENKEYARITYNSTPYTDEVGGASKTIHPDFSLNLSLSPGDDLEDLDALDKLDGANIVAGSDVGIYGLNLWGSGAAKTAGTNDKFSDAGFNKYEFDYILVSEGKPVQIVRCNDGGSAYVTFAKGAKDMRLLRVDDAVTQTINSKTGLHDSTLANNDAASTTYKKLNELEEAVASGTSKETSKGFASKEGFFVGATKPAAVGTDKYESKFYVVGAGDTELDEVSEVKDFGKYEYDGNVIEDMVKFGVGEGYDLVPPETENSAVNIYNVLRKEDMNGNVDYTLQGHYVLGAESKATSPSAFVKSLGIEANEVDGSIVISSSDSGYVNFSHTYDADTGTEADPHNDDVTVPVQYKVTKTKPEDMKSTDTAGWVESPGTTSKQYKLDGESTNIFYKADDDDANEAKKITFEGSDLKAGEVYYVYARLDGIRDFTRDKWYIPSESVLLKRIQIGGDVGYGFKTDGTVAVSANEITTVDALKSAIAAKSYMTKDGAKDAGTTLTGDDIVYVSMNGVDAKAGSTEMEAAIEKSLTTSGNYAGTVSFNTLNGEAYSTKPVDFTLKVTRNEPYYTLSLGEEPIEIDAGSTAEALGKKIASTATLTGVMETKEANEDGTLKNIETAEAVDEENLVVVTASNNMIISDEDLAEAGTLTVSVCDIAHMDKDFAPAAAETKIKINEVKAPVPVYTISVDAAMEVEAGTKADELGGIVFDKYMEVFDESSSKVSALPEGTTVSVSAVDGGAEIDDAWLAVSGNEAGVRVSLMFGDEVVDSKESVLKVTVKAEEPVTEAEYKITISGNFTATVSSDAADLVKEIKTSAVVTKDGATMADVDSDAISVNKIDGTEITDEDLGEEGEFDVVAWFKGDGAEAVSSNTAAVTVKEEEKEAAFGIELSSNRIQVTDGMTAAEVEAYVILNNIKFVDADGNDVGESVTGIAPSFNAVAVNGKSVEGLSDDDIVAGNTIEYFVSLHSLITGGELGEEIGRTENGTIEVAAEKPSEVAYGLRIDERISVSENDTVDAVEKKILDTAVVEITNADGETETADVPAASFGDLSVIKADGGKISANDIAADNTFEVRAVLDFEDETIETISSNAATVTVEAAKKEAKTYNVTVAPISVEEGTSAADFEAEVVKATKVEGIDTVDAKAITVKVVSGDATTVAGMLAKAGEYGIEVVYTDENGSGSGTADVTVNEKKAEIPEVNAYLAVDDFEAEQGISMNGFRLLVSENALLTVSGGMADIDADLFEFSVSGNEDIEDRLSASGNFVVTVSYPVNGTSVSDDAVVTITPAKQEESGQSTSGNTAPSANAVIPNTVSIDGVKAVGSDIILYPTKLPFIGANYKKALKGTTIVSISGNNSPIKSIGLKMKAGKTGTAEIKSIKFQDGKKIKKPGITIQITPYEITDKNAATVVDKSKIKNKNGKVKGAKCTFSDIKVGANSISTKAKKISPKDISLSSGKVTFGGNYTGTISANLIGLS